MLIQNLVKDILVSIADAKLHGVAYSQINTVSLYVAVLLGILHGRKLKVSIVAVVLSIGIERALVGPLATGILFVENGFQPATQQNGVVVFPFVPLIGFLLSKVLKRSWKELWDVMMIVPLTMFAGARIACTVVGCCYGYPCSWGIYNVSRGQFLFPIQLLESFVSVLILAFVFWREKRNGFIPDGRNVPIILISYGILRFFLEFFHDNEKIFLGCATTSFHCLIMILVGTITLVIIRKSERTIGEIRINNL